MFVTYENSSNKHVTIHKCGCSQIKKHGGEHVCDDGHYNKFDNYQDAKNYADSVGYPVKDCSFCNPVKQVVVLPV